MSSPPQLVVKNRFLGFLIWQSISSTIIFLFSKAILSSISNVAIDSSKANFSSSRRRNPFSPFLPSFTDLFFFFLFHLSQLLFSSTLSIVSYPHPEQPASPLELLTSLVRFLFVSGVSGGHSSAFESPELRRRVKVSLTYVLFVAASAASGVLALVSLCKIDSISDFVDGFWLIGRVGLRGIIVGLLYGLYYIYKRRWVLEFPIIQRPPYFSFKMGIPSATTQALKLSGLAYLLSNLLVVFLPHPFKAQIAMVKLMAEQVIFYAGNFAVFLCWEVTHHLHRVLHTKRFVFAPPKGSAAAETNPSEPLLAALEESNPGSLLQYLAYLDICMVCENNVDTWRRAAFFEETGDTYKRVVAVCLRPLELLASSLAEGLGSSVDKAAQLSKKLLPPANLRVDSKYCEPLNNLQLYAWCARTVASLTARSHREDKYGVAQLSGSNASVISMLISCHLAVESFMGKKTNIQSSNQFMGTGGIKWATVNTARIDIPAGKKRNSPLYSKAYSVADILRTSIYQLVSEFRDEMLTSSKAGLLEKDWVIRGKLPFGTHELLLQKLRLFLDYRAT